jgi:transcriptional accessory protein Tex/SPT6
MDKAAILLANRIASDVGVVDVLMDYCARRCGVSIKQANGENKKSVGKNIPSSSSFETYHDYKNKLANFRDHQVLAIRRGVDQKVLKLNFEIDDGPVDRIIQQAVFTRKHNHQL